MFAKIVGFDIFLFTILFYKIILNKALINICKEFMCFFQN